MGTETLATGETYRMEWDSDLEAVLFTWTSFASGEQFREGANTILEYFETNDVSKLIVDTSGIEAHDDDDQDWLEDEWTPAMIDAGMEYNCVVYPESAIAQMDRDRMQDRLEALPYDALWTDSMEEAKEWMSER
ncbi:hypothetical protein GRX03_15060 [Halovenus sp. WSH3]|uniref:STAS/SEC14 domain-containing protein n=1 Tax=Halovenus carboxidivorans TaxID=2692199 RepID=A0A6B0T7J6_9EURY|nr:hypothetical protein [Halovenus carboxidivorans]MXR52917.1 hypothetical protein [Halovenus carboxidivorans]